MLAQLESDQSSSGSYKRSFANASSARLRELKSLSDALEAFDPKSSNQRDFTELFQMAVQSLELSEDKLADLLETTRTTVNRWINGKNAPSRLARKSVLTILLKEVRKKLKRRASITKKVAA